MLQCQYIGRIGNHKNTSMYVLNTSKIILKEYNIVCNLPPKINVTDQFVTRSNHCSYEQPRKHQN